MPQNANDRFAILEKDIALSQQDRQQMREDLKEIKLSIKNFDDKFEELVDKLETRYAPYRVATAMKRIITTVWGVVLVTVITSVMIK